MGRRAKPAEVKKAQGNPGKRKIAETPATVPEIRTRAPAELNPAGRKVWEQLAPLMAQMKFLRTTDEPAFTRYCNHLARYWTLEKRIRKEGETYETQSAHGNMERVNPALRVQLEIDRRLESLEDRLGLNTRARQQILQALAGAPMGVPPTAPTPTSDEAPSRAPSPIGLLDAGTQTRH